MASELVIVAKILGAHGVRGDVRLKSFTANELDCLSYGPLTSDDGSVVIEAKSARDTGKGIIVTPKDHKEREAWEALKGVSLYVPRTSLPEAEADEFYIDDLVGLVVHDVERGAQIGTVKAVHNFGAGDIIEINLSSDNSVLMIPLTEDDVPEIDIEQGRIGVANLDLWNAPASDDDREMSE